MTRLTWEKAVRCTKASRQTSSCTAVTRGRSDTGRGGGPWPGPTTHVTKDTITMYSTDNLLLVQAIQRERLEEAERHRTILRLRQQHKQLRTSHARQQHTSVTRWLFDWLTA
ncbi:hypothetical protein [Isoptericola sp. NPDC057653]|uniref:hypothetical protein n=1 Tax=unclassified Isoptericola TaxID=2623355 RepID=UPI0036BA05F6